MINAVLGGIAEAVVSGCGEALIYDCFLENNEEDSYKQYLANINMWALRFSASATLLSSLLYKINVDLPMSLSILIQVISILAVSRLVDNKLFMEGTFNIKDEFRQQLDNIKGLVNNKIIIKLFFMYFVMMIIISNLNYTSQAFLPSIGIDTVYLGVIFFIFNIISSYGAKHSTKVKLKSTYILLVYGVLLIGLNFSGIYLSLIILCISRYINGMIWPILNADINSNIKDNRATILSYKSLFIQISFIVFDPVIGVSLDALGIRHTYALMGIITLVSLIIVLLLKKRKGAVALDN
ncbi:major facilitator superfamily protein [Clostridium tepidiprofundi DSM 19306]|uniref:Major facilitator superfamily protein n=2 Tax=Clostridium TaxID=1485 RepID=A0A151B372_9CLOT|nr:major facilitator superfamily protein [Clostridium tepidiprofundi DSM 19306]